MSLYTDESVAALNAALADATGGLSRVDQAKVDAMARSIEDAVAALAYKNADYSRVDTAIAKANALKKSEYKDFSGVQAAIDAVVRGKDIREQATVDGYADAIEAAIAALEKVPAKVPAKEKVPVKKTDGRLPQAGDASVAGAGAIAAAGCLSVGAAVLAEKRRMER